MKGTSGRRQGPKAYLGYLTAAEKETLRQAMHDGLRLRASRVRPAERVRGANRGRGAKPKRTRRRPGSWQGKFLRSYVRSGDMKAAARLCGVAYSSVRTAFCTQSDFRKQCLDALSEWSGRMLRHCARGALRGWRISPRVGRALLRYFEKRLAELSLAEVVSP